jgi:hypothetical protein
MSGELVGTSASRNFTNLGLKRKAGGGNVLGGTYTSKRANLATDVFTRGGSSLIGNGRPLSGVPPSGAALRITSRQNYNNVPVRFDATGGNYSDQRNRIALGGNTGRDNGVLNNLLATARGGPPVFGQGSPMLDSWSRDAATGLPVADGFPGLQDFAIRGQDPANRTTVEWKGFPDQKPSYFDSYNPSTERASVGTRGSEGTGLFIDQTASDASNGTVRTTYNPFKAYPYDQAAAKVSSSTKDTFGANPIAKFTVTLTNEAAALSDTELFGSMMWMALDLAPPPVQRVNAGSNTFGTHRPLPTHAVYPLATMNFLLKCSQLWPDNFDAVPSPEKAMSSFGFVGFAIAETGATKTRFLQREGRNRTRNVVLQFSGETKMNNVVGKARDAYGKWVGFIVKGVNDSEIYAMNSEQTPSYNINAAEPNSIQTCVPRDPRKQLSQNPIQFIPWMDRTRNNRFPRLEELTYYDDFGCRRFGKYVEVGFITDEYQSRDQAIISRTPFSANAALNSGALRINIRMTRGVRF